MTILVHATVCKTAQGPPTIRKSARLIPAEAKVLNRDLAKSTKESLSNGEPGDKPYLKTLRLNIDPTATPANNNAPLEGSGMTLKV